MALFLADSPEVCEPRALRADVRGQDVATATATADDKNLAADDEDLAADDEDLAADDEDLAADDEDLADCLAEDLAERLFFGKAGSAAVCRRVFERCRLPVLGEGYIFIRLRLRSEGKTPILQVVMERNDGAPMTVGNCATFSRFLSPMLEGEGLVSAEMRLEVSSPGLERPLTRLSDFQRFAGSDVVLALDKQKAQAKRAQAKREQASSTLDLSRNFLATLVGVEGRSVVVEREGERLSIPVEDMVKAQLVAVFTTDSPSAALKSDERSRRE